MTFRKVLLSRMGRQKKTFNLAIVATGEFYQGNGGNATAATAVITAAVNAIEAIYENELAVNFNLLTPVLYTDPTNDPFDPAKWIFSHRNVSTGSEYELQYE